MTAPRNEYAAEAEAILGGKPASDERSAFFHGIGNQPDPRIAIATALAVEWIKVLATDMTIQSWEDVATQSAALAAVGADGIMQRLGNTPA